jgi:hypothetical protein
MSTATNNDVAELIRIRPLSQVGFGPIIFPEWDNRSVLPSTLGISEGKDNSVS